MAISCRSHGLDLSQGYRVAFVEMCQQIEEGHVAKHVGPLNILVSEWHGLPASKPYAKLTASFMSTQGEQHVPIMQTYCITRYIWCLFRF